jgi:hypothetical protein
LALISGTVALKPWKPGSHSLEPLLKVPWNIQGYGKYYFGGYSNVTILNLPYILAEVPKGNGPYGNGTEQPIDYFILRTAG